jgi:ComF family protein
MPVLDTKEGKKYCPQCDGRNYSFTRAIACIDYKRDGKEIIHELKFSGRLRLCKPLAGELANRIKIEIDKFPDVIIPVPIHPHRSKVRGFNQSEKLGRELSKLLGLKQDINVLHKIKDTVPQSTLGKQERLKNPKGAYRADNSKFNYKTCILLDDVMTTGATLSECSSVLRKAGFKRIYAAVVAR